MNQSIILPQKAKLIGSDACEACKHASEFQPTPAGLQALCRRFPPVPQAIIGATPEGMPTQLGAVSNWPTVLPHNTCGEFKRKIHHGHASAS